MPDHDSPPLSARISVILVGLMCALPFLQPRHSYPLPSFYSEWLAFVLGLAALFPLVLRRYNRPLHVPWIAIPPLVLAAVLMIHIALLKSTYPQQTLLAVAYLVWGASIIVLSGVLTRQFGLVTMYRTIAWFVLVGGILNAAAAILQHYDARGFLEPLIATKMGDTLYGNLAQENHFADQMALTLASLVFLNATGRLRTAIAAVLCIPLLVVLDLSGSRSAWLFLAAIATLALVFFLRDRSAVNRRALVFCLLLIPGFALAHFLTYLPWLAGATPQVTTAERLFRLAAGNSVRFQLWREAWLMFLDAPLLGVGWGQFAWHYFLFGGSLAGVSLTGLYNHAHNVLFQLLAETGLAGALVILVGSVLWIAGVVRTTMRIETWWLLAALAILGVHSMLEYPLWNSYFLGLACVFLGAGETRIVTLHQTRLARTAVGALMLIGAATSFSMLSGYQRLEAVLYRQYADSTQETLAHSQREMMSVYAGFLLAPYVELAYARDISLDRVNIDEKLMFTGRVMRFAPTGMVAYRHAALWALKGNEREALRYLDHAVAVYPTLLEKFAAEFNALDLATQPVARAFSDALNQRLLDRRTPGAKDG